MIRLIAFFKMFRYDLLVLLAAMKHKDTPKQVKGLLVAALLYLVSPIDLIPDAIPLAGVLDDAVLLPAAIMGLSNMLPSHVRYDAERAADRAVRYMPAILIGATIFLVLWVGLIVYGLYCLIF